MCAIHGILGNKPELVAKMIKVAHHRGPDGNGQFNDEHIALGHNLLSIVDSKENGEQPFYMGDFVMVFNGEIYNYQDLKAGIGTPTSPPSWIFHKWKTNTDTELLMKGLIEMGTSFLKSVDGMFAFALYNKKTGVLLLGRDSNGAKPIYYGVHPDLKCMCFSSEIKSLLEIGFERKISIEGFKHYYRQGYNSGHLTIFHNIHKFIPGQITHIYPNAKIHSVNLNDVKKDIKVLPNSKHKDFEKTREDLAVEVREKLKIATKRTLQGYRDIGLFLSGGIDSCGILTCMKDLNVKPKAFTSRFAMNKDNYDSVINEDSDVAKRYCEKLAVEHHELVQGEDEYIDNIEKTFLALEEPRQGKSLPTYYNTNKYLRDNGIIVTLSGDGGDELLAGYKHHRFPPWKEKLKDMAKQLPALKNKELDITLEEQEAYLNGWLPKKNLQGDELNDLMYIECMNALSEDFLVRNDKLGGSFGMEARFPMLSNEFRDFVRSIPSAYKTVPKFYTDNAKIYNKTLLKRAFTNGRMPQWIVERSKTGWRFPTDQLVVGSGSKPAKDNNKIREFIRDVLTDKEICEIFSINEMKISTQFLNNFEWDPQGKAGPGLLASRELFTVLNFAIWKKAFKMSF